MDANITAFSSETDTKTIQSLTSYAGALSAAIQRIGNIEIGVDPFRASEGPKLVFAQIPDSHTVDYVHTGRHTMLYSLEGTSKTYRVMIEPVDETHGGKVSG